MSSATNIFLYTSPLTPQRSPNLPPPPPPPPPHTHTHTHTHTFSLNYLPSHFCHCNMPTWSRQETRKLLISFSRDVILLPLWRCLFLKGSHAIIVFLFRTLLIWLGKMHLCEHQISRLVCIMNGHKLEELLNLSHYDTFGIDTLFTKPLTFPSTKKNGI